MLSASEPCCFVAFVTSSWLTHCFFVSLSVFDLLLFYWTTTVQQLTIGTTTVTRPFLPFMWFLHIRLHTEISPVSFSPLPGIYRFSYLIPLHMLLATRRHTYLFFFYIKKKLTVLITWLASRDRKQRSGPLPLWEERGFASPLFREFGPLERSPFSPIFLQGTWAVRREDETEWVLEKEMNTTRVFNLPLLIISSTSRYNRV